MTSYDTAGNGYENGDENEELFGITEFEDELTPENLIALAAISRSLRGRQRETGVRAKDLAETARAAAEREATVVTNRLEELQVRGVRTTSGVDLFTYRHIERFPDISDLPHLVDDVHYEVYKRRKEHSPSPYISVSLDEILSELTVMNETHVDAVNYHRQQSKDAINFFEKLKIEEGSIHEAMTSPEGRFMVRSLHRLFHERPMAKFVANFRKERQQKMDERPVDFLIVAARAMKWFERQYTMNKVLGETVTIEDEEKWRAEFSQDEEPGKPAVLHVPMPGKQPKELDENDPDEMHWYGLRMREMDRARAFALPVAEYLAAMAPAEQ